MRKIIAIVLALFVSSSSGQSNCAALKQEAAQYASRLLATMYENPRITADLFSASRARIDSYQREIASCSN